MRIRGKNGILFTVLFANEFSLQEDIFSTYLHFVTYSLDFDVETSVIRKININFIYYNITL